MTTKHPVALAAATVAALGLVAIGRLGGVEAILGPALAAITATIFVLLGR